MPLKNNNLFLLELSETESTNNYAMGWIQGRLLPKGHDGVMNGMAVLAYHQTQGRGQRGKKWQSPPGESLSLSIVLKPDFLLATQGFSLLSAIAVAVAQVLESYLGDETKIKWSNDLYWRNRKVGGILIENVVKGAHYSFAVAGIGINVLQKSFPPFLENPASIKQVTGKEYAVKDVAVKIQQEVVDAVKKLETNSAAFYEAYNQKLFKKEELVKLKKESRVFETIIKGVNKHGELMTGEDGLTTFKFGEVEWRL
jgi:BirA family transcriptional regulator, biotin operon repressor / biotin---[acetyl-CoA-carboxylase] ligase